MSLIIKNPRRVISVFLCVLLLSKFVNAMESDYRTTPNFNDYLDGQELVAKNILRQFGYNIDEITVDLVEFLYRFVDLVARQNNKPLPTIYDVQNHVLPSGVSTYPLALLAHFPIQKVPRQLLLKPVHLFVLLLSVGGGLLGYKTGRYFRHPDISLDHDALLNLTFNSVCTGTDNPDETEGLSRSSEDEQHHSQASLLVTPEEQMLSELFNVTLHEMCSFSDKPDIEEGDNLRGEGWLFHVYHYAFAESNNPESAGLEIQPSPVIENHGGVVVDDDVSRIITSISIHFLPSPALTPDHPADEIVSSPRIQRREEVSADFGWSKAAHTVLMQSMFSIGMLPCAGYELQRCRESGSKKNKHAALERVVIWGGCSMGGGFLTIIGDSVFSWLTEPPQKTPRQSKKGHMQSTDTSSPILTISTPTPTPTPTFTDLSVDATNSDMAEDRIPPPGNVTRGFFGFMNTGLLGAGCEAETLTVYTIILFTSETLAEEHKVSHHVAASGGAMLYYPVCYRYTDYEEWGVCNLLTYSAFLGANTFMQIYSPDVENNYKNILFSGYIALAVSMNCQIVKKSGQFIMNLIW